MKVHRLMQEVIKPKTQCSILKNPIMFYSIFKQRAILLVPGPNPKTLFCKRKVERFIKFIHKAFLGKYNKIIYNGHNKKKFQILCQFCTKICRLNSYISKIRVANLNQCWCNRGRVTIDYFLFRGPR